MSSIEFEKEFNLTADQAYKLIGQWLVAINAKIEDHTEPLYVKAAHGSILKHVSNHMKKKTLHITVQPLESNALGVKIQIKASLDLWRRHSVMEEIRKSWDERLISPLWTFLQQTKQDDLLWQVKVTQFLITLPQVQKESDFEHLMKKLCERIQTEPLTPDQVLQITEALKLQLLTAKLFAPTKKEKLLHLAQTIAKAFFGDTLPVLLSGALSGLVDYLCKEK